MDDQSAGTLFCSLCALLLLDPSLQPQSNRNRHRWHIRFRSRRALAHAAVVSLDRLLDLDGAVPVFRLVLFEGAPRRLAVRQRDESCRSAGTRPAAVVVRNCSRGSRRQGLQAPVTVQRSPRSFEAEFSGPRRGHAPAR